MRVRQFHHRPTLPSSTTADEEATEHPLLLLMTMLVAVVVVVVTNEDDVEGLTRFILSIGPHPIFVHTASIMEILGSEDGTMVGT